MTLFLVIVFVSSTFWIFIFPINCRKKNQTVTIYVNIHVGYNDKQYYMGFQILQASLKLVSIINHYHASIFSPQKNEGQCAWVATTLKFSKDNNNYTWIKRWEETYSASDLRPKAVTSKTCRLRQTSWNPGWSVMHWWESPKRSITSPQRSISLQHWHSSGLVVNWIEQFEQVHLKNQSKHCCK